MLSMYVDDLIITGEVEEKIDLVQSIVGRIKA
jgi:hypothetical protein